MAGFYDQGLQATLYLDSWFHVETRSSKLKLFLHAGHMQKNEIFSGKRD